MRKAIELTVNGSRVTAEVEPRLQLAEFLREHLLLTGTHLGCEHGVCGACTVEIDGAPARSCIAYAVACNGSDVRTIEGFDGDAVMAELREAFSAHHALQCGYCTPGMLVTARDIVLRVPDADEARIRKELAGNLCRCTGYVGIVRAIDSVLAGRRQKTAGRAGESSRVHSSEASGIAESHPVRAPEPVTIARADAPAAATTSGSAAQEKRTAARAPGGRALHQSFVVRHPREKVWEYFGRLGDVTACLPGAAVTGTPADDRVDTTLRVKLGPIAAEFAGTASAERDPSTCTGVIHGSARDARSSSTTRGTIRYALGEEAGGKGTRVDLDIDYTLTGPLAQFGRSSIVDDIARRMTAAFAQNLEARLNENGDRAANEGRERTAELHAGSLLLAALWARLKALFGRSNR